MGPPYARFLQPPYGQFQIPDPLGGPGHFQEVWKAMSKKLFGLLAVTLGAFALTACCGSPCEKKGPAVYKKPCCAQSGGVQSCGGSMQAPAPAPAPAPKPAGGQMACGAGKCG